MVRRRLIVLLVALVQPVCADEIPIPPNASPEVRNALERQNKLRQAPVFVALNRAAQLEPRDPVESERLLKQAFQLAMGAPIPDATAICHFQLALFYYRQRRTKEADEQLALYEDALIHKLLVSTDRNQLADIDSWCEMSKISADLHQYNGRSDIAERLLKARLDFVRRIRPKLPQVDDALFEDRLEWQAWRDLHDCYFRQGREDLASQIWKKYPAFETSYKQMKEYGLKMGRYPPFPPNP